MFFVSNLLSSCQAGRRRFARASSLGRVRGHFSCEIPFSADPHRAGQNARVGTCSIHPPTERFRWGFGVCSE